MFSTNLQSAMPAGYGRIRYTTIAVATRQVLDPDVLNLLRDEAARGRSHTSFWSWHERSADGKALVETFAAKKLEALLARDGCEFFTNARAARSDWPDCVAESIAGKKPVAIEITELVRGETLRPNSAPQPWKRTDLLNSIQSLVTKKDERSPGEMYEANVLLVVTDEMFLTPSFVLETIGSASFDVPHAHLTHAYLLLGPQGSTLTESDSEYPYFKLAMTV